MNKKVDHDCNNVNDNNINYWIIKNELCNK